jgi:hypothetical protein
MKIAKMIWFEDGRQHETSIVSQNLLHAYLDARNYPKSKLVLEDRGIQITLDIHQREYVFTATLAARLALEMQF